jgi:hypothetical protein
MIIMDPCMPEDVEGDLLKFRLIVTSILNFALKSSKKVSMQINANFSVKTNGYAIYFSISFTPTFEINVENLKLLFSNENISLSNQTKMNNHVGLSIHLVSNLVQVMGGEFTEITKRKDGEIFIMFTLPFERIENSKQRLVRKTDIRLNSSRSYENGSHVLKSPEINSKIMIMTKFNQESGDAVGDNGLNVYLKNIKRAESAGLDKLVQDERSVSKVRNSIKLMEKPKLDEYQSQKSIDKRASDKNIDELEEVKIKDNTDRNELNTTIVPGKSRFPIKYTKKAQETKRDLRKNSDAPAFWDEAGKFC